MSGRYETDRLELGPRVAAALAKAEELLDSMLNPAQADGLACVNCNRPAGDGPMVPLTALPSLFRCADELGCLPEALVP